jgi:hypothetical protein
MRLTEADRQLTGRVDIDEAYLGGQRVGGKRGRGSQNKVPFVAAVQTTEDGLPHLACLSPRPLTNEAMKDFLACHTAVALTLVSDGLNCFKVAASMGAAHEREITGGGKASVLNDKFTAINTLLGNIKTALTGTYDAIKFAKFAYRYLAKVQFRFNRRYNLRKSSASCSLLSCAHPDGQSAESGLLSFIANQDCFCATTLPWGLMNTR